MPRIAVVGTGSIGGRHLETLHYLGADVVAIPWRAERRLDLETQGTVCAASIAKASRFMQVEAAVICTDTHRHVADTAEALECGLHVLCEKPLAATASEAKHLPALAESRGCSLFVGYCLRFDEGLVAFRSRLSEIGTIHSVRIECRSYLPDWRSGRDYRESYSARASDGGVLRDLSHEIDYALWLFGPAQTILGDLHNTGRLGIESEELAEGVWQTAAGTSVSIGLDYLSRSPVRFVRASGAEGELMFDFITGTLTLLNPGEKPVCSLFPRDRNAVYEAQARAFLSVLAGEVQTNLATADEGLKVLRLCDAWRRSASSGHAERIPV